MSRANVLWLLYKRVRSSIGLSFGLILIYGVYNNVLDNNLILAALGFMLLHLFGDCYNDYWDYVDDVRNKRKDKLTTTDVLTRNQILMLSYLIMFIGLIVLKITDGSLFFAGVAYSLLLFAYSHPSIRLKKYDVWGYALTESPWIIIPILLDNRFSIPHNTYTSAFILFYFFQYMFLLCQKDSTDLADPTNLFIRNGWRKASIMCIIFALLSSAALLYFSTSSIALFFVWVINFAAKARNVQMIWSKTIERGVRGRLVSVEFLTPFLFLLGRLL